MSIKTTETSHTSATRYVRIDRPSTLPAVIMKRRPIEQGDRGVVVRLVHHTIEGAPFEGPPRSPTLVQVLFDGQEQVIAFEPGCLRKVPARSPSPNVVPLHPKDKS